MTPIRMTAAALALVLAWPAFAADMATGDQIKAAIPGNTVQGKMNKTGDYAELYNADGTIKGKDYSGKWSVKGDTMCFAYGNDPEMCWAVKIDGDKVTWMKDGQEDGSGQILPGNPNNF